jgi:uncharacterized protein (DUF1015 family)
MALAGDLSNLVAPPYDVIPETDLAHYRALSPYNVVRLTRPGHDYEKAARLLDRWLEERIVDVDPPSMYVHEVTFDGRTRRDLIASLRLQPYSDRVVLPHERTHRGPKEDRLALMRAIRTSLEPLWFVYEGRATGVPEIVAKVASRAAAVSFGGPERTRHRLWVISDPAIHGSIHAALAGLQVLIADGHHRYETALAYADEAGGGPDVPSRFTLALLTDIDDPGLVVLPTHRVMKTGIAVTGGEATATLDETLRGLRGRVAAGAYRDHQFQVLPLDGDVAVLELHRQVIDNLLGKRDPEEFLMYTRDAQQAVTWVDQGAGAAAFFLDAPDMRDVLRLAREGKTLPQKSTYFHPKPPTGMVMDRFSQERPL